MSVSQDHSSTALPPETARRGSYGAAARLEALVGELFGVELPVGVSAWDGSTAGPDGTPRVVLRRRRALRHVMWCPGELGLARAYVSGDLDVEGDLVEALRRCWALARRLRGSLRFGPGRWRRIVATAVRIGAIGSRPAPPEAEARLSGSLHSRRRDRSAISHHYDAGNDLYELLLDPRMAYSSAYFDSGDTGLAQAQEDKLDLICRKLGLVEGQRMLDVGCGWGSLILFAAERYRVRVTGVTLSGQQAAFIRERIGQCGLADLVEVRHQDYREIDDAPFDAVASVEMGEHVGEKNYAEYAAKLFALLKPRGRLVLQQMSRGATAPGGGAFIEHYVAPDMSMVSIGRTLDHLERAGFEVRDVEMMREHYVHTVRPWARTLERRWDEAVGLVGAEEARVWRLYLAGGALAFEENRMGVNQIMSVRSTPEGVSGLPLTSRRALLDHRPEQ